MKRLKIQTAFWKIVLMGLIIFGNRLAFGQEADLKIEIENIEKSLEIAPTKEKPPILNTLAAKYLKNNPLKSRECAEKALELSKLFNNNAEKTKSLILIGKANTKMLQYSAAIVAYQLVLDSARHYGNDTLVSDVMFLLGETYYNLDDYNNAISHFSSSVNIEEKQNRLHVLEMRYENLARAYKSANNYTQSLIYYNKAIDIEETFSDKENLAGLYNSIGILYADLGNYEKALENYLKSLKIVESLNNKQRIARALNNIGIVYADWGNKEKALEFYQKSLIIEKELGNRQGIGDSYNNIGIIYSDWNQNEIAIDYYNRALNIYNEFNDSSGIAKVLNNMGESLLAQAQFDKALDYLFKSLEIEKEIGNKIGIAESYHAIANAYYDEGELSKAEENNFRSFKIADSLQFNSVLLLNYNLFYKIYDTRKNYNKALEFFKKYSSQKDSIYSRQFHDKLAELQIKYEIEKIDKEKNATNKDLINSIRENRTQRIYLIVIFFLMLIFGLLVYFDIRSKIIANKKLKKINDELIFQKEELTHALDELSRSESKYRNLVEYSPTGIVYLDKKGNILEINKKMLEILGSPSEAATKEINCLSFPPLQKVGLSESILKSLETRKMIFCETQYTSKWGKIIEIRYYVTPILNKKGNVSNIILNVEDISLSKEFERSKIRSEEKYRILVENSLQAMLIIKKDRLVFGNARMEELSQYKFDELSGKKNWLKTIIHPDDYVRVASNINDALARKKTPARNECRYIRKNGDVRWLESQGSIVELDGNLAILVVAIDITERKEAELILIDSEKQLRMANAMKDKFFSIIAHDLKNPFNAILGFSNLLFEAYDNFDDKQRKNFIKNICEASGNTFKLLQNLLEWSRIQTGKVEILPQVIDIAEVVKENFIVLKPAANSKKIELETSIKGPIMAYADSNMVKAIIRNLISNAIKFTNSGGKIDVSAVSSGSEITISVADTGVGIKPTDLKRLFRIDDHFRTSGTQNEEGSGLGLILCKEFVEKNGGKIWAESKTGFGSKFSFTLPSEVQ